ncbi:MAG: hypothetical protein IKK32_04225 [Oscillospiraceae bacterium]|nr:hypothetical protein [Oscillospiraceae bacterium]
MIALYIIGGIILFIAILLHCPVRAKISFIDKKFDISVKYLFFTIYPMKEKKPKKKKIKNKKKKKSEDEKKAVSEETKEETLSSENGEETKEKSSSEPPPIPDKKKKEKKPKLTKEEKEERKKELLEKIELVKMILASASKGLKKLLSAIRLYDIAIDIDVANEDAYEAAIGYGRMNMIVYNAISFLRTFFTVSIDHIKINCVYNSDKSKYDAAVNIHAIPSTILCAAIIIGTKFLVLYQKKKRADKKALKQAEKELKNQAA